MGISIPVWSPALVVTYFRYYFTFLRYGICCIFVHVFSQDAFHYTDILYDLLTKELGRRNYLIDLQ